MSKTLLSCNRSDWNPFVLVAVFKIQNPQNSVIIVEKILRRSALNVAPQIRSILRFAVNVGFLYNKQTE
jgi:hypothetical protein